MKSRKVLRNGFKNMNGMFPIDSLRDPFERSPNHRIYYQYNLNRLPVCTLPIHALLHIADDIRRAGPVWCYWAFAMERYCGLLANSSKSRRFPYVSLSRRICDIAQLNSIKVIYGLTKELDLSDGQSSVAKGQAYPQCEQSLSTIQSMTHIR
jgi:hypothetical protein